MFLETICIVDGIIRNVDAHAERMRQTGSHFGFTVLGRADSSRNTRKSRIFESELARQLSELGTRMPEDLQQGIVKCRVIYRETIKEITFERYLPKKVQSLKLVEASPNYAFKFADRRALNALLEQKGSCDEILITRKGVITDTSYSNVVFNKGDQYFTPKNPLLNGTKRQKLLREGRIREKEIVVDALGQYERVYLINAMLDLGDNISLPVDYIQI